MTRAAILAAALLCAGPAMAEDANLLVPPSDIAKPTCYFESIGIPVCKTTSHDEADLRHAATICEKKRTCRWPTIITNSYLDNPTCSYPEEWKDACERVINDIGKRDLGFVRGVAGMQ